MVLAGRKEGGVLSHLKSSFSGSLRHEGSAVVGWIFLFSVCGKMRVGDDGVGMSRTYSSRTGLLSPLFFFLEV